MMDAVAAPASTNDLSLRRAAQRFEALAINEMLAPMFDTVDPSAGRFGGGAGEAAFRPMLVQAFSEQMAARGGLGLADSIYHALLGAQEAGQPGRRIGPSAASHDRRR